MRSDGVNEEEYLTLSGVQHYAFCPRQWALIFVEQQWQDNERTDVPTDMPNSVNTFAFPEVDSSMTTPTTTALRTRTAGE